MHWKQVDKNVLNK